MGLLRILGFDFIYFDESGEVPSEVYNKVQDILNGDVTGGGKTITHSSLPKVQTPRQKIIKYMKDKLHWTDVTAKKDPAHFEAVIKRLLDEYKNGTLKLD